MGFFKELKEDFSQAVNELLPEDALFEDFPDHADEAALGADGSKAEGMGPTAQKKNGRKKTDGRKKAEEEMPDTLPEPEWLPLEEEQAASGSIQEAMMELATSEEGAGLPDMRLDETAREEGLEIELLQQEAPAFEPLENGGEGEGLPDVDTESQIAALRKEVFEDWLAKQAVTEMSVEGGMEELPDIGAVEPAFKKEAAEASLEKEEPLVSEQVESRQGIDREVMEKSEAAGAGEITETQRDTLERSSQIPAIHVIEDEDKEQKMEETNMAELDSVFNQASAAGDNDADLIAKLMEDGAKEGSTAEETAAQMEDEKELGAVLENMEPEDDTTIITKGTIINGNIISNGSLEVLGTVKGDLECLGKLSVVGTVKGNSAASEIYVNTARLEGSLTSKGSVKIGAGTIVIGDIKGESAVVAGAVKGEVDVNGPVIIDSTAIVKGNINAKSVQINNGAVVDGYCSLSYAAVDIDNFFDEEEK